MDDLADRRSIVESLQADDDVEFEPGQSASLPRAAEVGVEGKPAERDADSAAAARISRR